MSAATSYRMFEPVPFLSAFGQAIRNARVSLMSWGVSSAGSCPNRRGGRTSLARCRREA